MDAGASREANTIGSSMASLAEDVLPLVRTRVDVSRWGAANEHGPQMHAAVDLLDAALRTADPVEVCRVVHAALASAVKVIARADDSSGIIGDACRRLLSLHPRVAAAAGVAPAKLVDWMMRFQFEGTSTISRSTPSPTRRHWGTRACAPTASASTRRSLAELLRFMRGSQKLTVGRTCF